MGPYQGCGTRYLDTVLSKIHSSEKTVADVPVPEAEKDLLNLLWLEIFVIVVGVFLLGTGALWCCPFPQPTFGNVLPSQGLAIAKAHVDMVISTTQELEPSDRHELHDSLVELSDHLFEDLRQAYQIGAHFDNGVLYDIRLVHSNGFQRDQWSTEVSFVLNLTSTLIDSLDATMSLYGTTSAVIASIRVAVHQQGATITALLDGWRGFCKLFSSTETVEFRKLERRSARQFIALTHAVDALLIVPEAVHLERARYSLLENGLHRLASTIQQMTGPNLICHDPDPALCLKPTRQRQRNLMAEAEQEFHNLLHRYWGNSSDEQVGLDQEHFKPLTLDSPNEK